MLLITIVFVGLIVSLVLRIEALEDNDDNDDTATGNCEWVLSIRDKIKLYSLVFKPAAASSTSLRVIIGTRAKSGVGEDATDADATAFCTTAASIRSKLLAATETNCFLLEMLLLQLLLQLHVAHGLQLLQNSNAN